MVEETERVEIEEEEFEKKKAEVQKPEEEKEEEIGQELWVSTGSSFSLLPAFGFGFTEALKPSYTFPLNLPWWGEPRSVEFRGEGLVYKPITIKEEMRF